MIAVRVRSAMFFKGDEETTKAMARMRATAKTGQNIKKREARAEQTSQIRPGQFNPESGSVKSFDVNSTAKRFSKGQRVLLGQVSPASY